MTIRTARIPRKYIVWMVVVLPVVAMLFSSAYLAYAQPGCASCHNKDAKFETATAKSSHATVQCVACHVSSAPLDRVAFSFRQMFHMLIPVVSGQGRDWSSVANQRCLSCHQTINDDVVSAKGVRIDHSSCSVDSNCTDCHSTVAHGEAAGWVRSYDMETCLECHVTKASTECNLCHEKKDREARVSKGIFAITHGKEWRKTHGMGNSATCSVCHTAAKCEKCHGVGLPHDATFFERHSQVAADPKAKCFTCHDKRFCADCHGTGMPHTKAFTRGHAKTAEADPKLCARCHIESDCIKCHETHVHPGGAVGNLKKPSTGTKAGD